ncbi:MAG: redoxin domain-containing protein [Pirellulaceae bacterium]|nr:redoxin domain-containing protein [Pirellulaceae bacterium]
MLLQAVLCGCLLGATPADTSQVDSRIGRPIDVFSLPDHDGRPWSLADVPDARAVVITFLGTECPIVRLYAGVLQELNDQFADRGVVFVGIDANRQDSAKDLAAFARELKIRFPLLRDEVNRVADRFGAQRTPEVFVLDHDRVVRYHGRIDDRYSYEVQRDRAERHFLADAIGQLLAGEQVTTPETELYGCLIGRVTPESRGSRVTYTDQVRDILQRRCVECHRQGDIAPFALSDYDEAVGWAPMIAEVVRQGRMPPWHAAPDYGEFADDRRLSSDEKQAIYQWVADGAPRGDREDLSRAPQHAAPAWTADGWQLPRSPDLVVPMATEPFVVPARGEIKYQYFVVDSQLQEDKWVQISEVRPGNRQVVHHVLVFAQAPGQRLASGEMGGFLAAYVPGLRAKPFPAGMAKRIRAGSKLIFQVHYTPIGTEQTDLSSLGLIFAAADEIQHEVITAAAVETKFAIPPYDGNYRVESRSRRAPVDVQLLGLMPHMHLRGKSFRYEARYPDGSDEILLDVPRYDFNWQTAYRLKTPKTMPAGTRIHCVAHFDNSAANPANPDPASTVRWGDQTREEMMIGYFDIAIPVGSAR